MKWIPLLFLVLALAGCADKTEAPDPGTETETFEHQVDVPIWNVGDMWEYQTSGGGLIKLIVTSTEGGSYTLDTNDTNLAFFDDQFDISYIGPIGKEDLTGKQGTSLVQFFDFPLHANKTWNAMWDGEILDIVAHDIGNDRFHVIASKDGNLVNQYQYSNSTRFFDWISFTDGAGTEQFRMDLVSAQQGWSGEAIRVESEAVEVFAPGPSVKVFQMNAEDADVFLQIGYGCTAGAYSIAVGPLESVGNIALAGQGAHGYSDEGPCPATAQFGGVIATSPFAENWGLETVGLETVGGTLWLREFQRITL
ncbi:MAG: hypothetical protein ACPHK8_02620 [Thermoplasmatota archaeon]